METGFRIQELLFWPYNHVVVAWQMSSSCLCIEHMQQTYRIVHTNNTLQASLLK